MDYYKMELLWAPPAPCSGDLGIGDNISVGSSVQSNVDVPRWASPLCDKNQEQVGSAAVSELAAMHYEFGVFQNAGQIFMFSSPKHQPLLVLELLRDAQKLLS